MEDHRFTTKLICLEILKCKISNFVPYLSQECGDGYLGSSVGYDSSSSGSSSIEKVIILSFF